jgi:hypothetical protein
MYVKCFKYLYVVPIVLVEEDSVARQIFEQISELPKI